MKGNCISIVIPSYNYGRYIDRCMDSLLAQTYQDYEVFLVDDGSKDNTEEVFAKYVERDERFHYIKKENGGVGTARNLGKKLANGNWVTFIDADDYVEPDYLERLLTCALENHVPISACSFVQEQQDGTLIAHGNNPTVEKVVDNRRYCEELCLPDTLYTGVITMKLIAKDVVDQLDFTGLKYGEDTEYLIRLMSMGMTIAYFPYEGYHYVRVSDSSTMRSDVPEYVVKLDHTQCWSRMYDRESSMEPVHYNLLMHTYSNTLECAMLSLTREKAKAVYDAKRSFLKEHCENCLNQSDLNPHTKKEFDEFLNDPDAYWLSRTA